MIDESKTVKRPRNLEFARIYEENGSIRLSIGWEHSDCLLSLYEAKKLKSWIERAVSFLEQRKHRGAQ